MYYIPIILLNYNIRYLIRSEYPTKSRSRVSDSFNSHIALKFDTQLDGALNVNSNIVYFTSSGQ